jgi:hypothetical protein
MSFKTYFSKNSQKFFYLTQFTLKDLPLNFLTTTHTSVPNNHKFNNLKTTRSKYLFNELNNWLPDFIIVCRWASLSHSKVIYGQFLFLVFLYSGTLPIVGMLFLFCCKSSRCKNVFVGTFWLFVFVLVRNWHLESWEEIKLEKIRIKLWKNWLNIFLKFLSTR